MYFSAKVETDKDLSNSVNNSNTIINTYETSNKLNLIKFY